MNSYAPNAMIARLRQPSGPSDVVIPKGRNRGTTPNAIVAWEWGAREAGRALRKDMFLPSKHLLSAFYKTPPSKNPSKNLVFTENPLQAPSKNPSKKHLLLENLLRTLLRSVLLHDGHDPLGVHFRENSRDSYFLRKLGLSRSSMSLLLITMPGL